MDYGIIVGEIEEIEKTPSLSSKFLKKAGLMFLLSGLAIPMGIVTGEISYLRSRIYATGGNGMGDLGNALPLENLAAQSLISAFNTAIILGGIMILAGAYYYYRFSRDRVVGALLFLSGLGMIGLGIFPGNIPVLYPFFYVIAFVFGAAAAIASWRTAAVPIRYVFVFLGALSLFLLILSRIFYPFFGVGGVERWVVYPVALWLISFGSYILGKESGKEIYAARVVRPSENK